MSTSPVQASLFCPSNSSDKSKLMKEFIITPYEKVLSILNEIKQFLSTVKKSQNHIKQLNWVIQIISSRSLYTYEILNQKEKFEKIQKELPEFKHFIEFLSDSNEQFTQKNNILLKETAKLIDNKNSNAGFNKFGLLTPSRNVKRKKQMTICFPKHLNEEDKNENHSFDRNCSRFLTNTPSNNSNETNNNANISLKNLREMIDKGLMSAGNDYSNDIPSPSDRLIFDEEDDSVNDSGLNLKPQSHRSSENCVSYNPFQVEKCINDAGFDVKDILSISFNIFQLTEIVGYNNVMVVVGKIIFDYFGFDEQIININKLESFLSTLSVKYHQKVPYHNAIHGTDVAQTVAMVIIHSNFEEIAFTNINDILSMVTACLGHDVAHPGMNNNFQMNSLSDIALTYNDISVLENYHSATLFRILRKNENNIFDKFSDFDFKIIRKRIISQILATDMVHHGKVLGVIKSKVVSRSEKDEIEIVNKDSKNIFEEQEALFDFIVHAGDIAHNAKKFCVSLKWVELLSNEFWLQGDKEKNLNIPVSFLCDRTNVDVPKSQVGFIKAFILPVFEVVSMIFPSLNVYYENANHNLEMWDKLSKEGRRTGFTPEKKKSSKSSKSSKSNEDKINIVTYNYSSNNSNSNNKIVKGI